jgi:pyrophosphate--fructose-6-phosphate 1-phosphotransferase
MVLLSLEGMILTPMQLSLLSIFNQGAVVQLVVGVPKTIDGDLQNEHVAMSFGFDSACKVYSEMIGNIARDALSAKVLPFHQAYGQICFYIALECALSTRVNYTLIGEEVFKKKMTLSQITSDIADMICKRSLLGKDFGVVLIPEGLIEFIPEIADLIKEINGILLQNDRPSQEDVLKDLSDRAKSSFLSIQCFAKTAFATKGSSWNVQAL